MYQFIEGDIISYMLELGSNQNNPENSIWRRTTDAIDYVKRLLFIILKEHKSYASVVDCGQQS